MVDSSCWFQSLHRDKLKRIGEFFLFDYFCCAPFEILLENKPLPPIVLSRGLLPETYTRGNRAPRLRKKTQPIFPTSPHEYRSAPASCGSPDEGLTWSPPGAEPRPRCRPVAKYCSFHRASPGRQTTKASVKHPPGIYKASQVSVRCPVCCPLFHGVTQESLSNDSFLPSRVLYCLYRADATTGSW